MFNQTSGRTNSSPFTATQWQELERQALIFKYMASGVPVPPELLYPVKRSLESSLDARLFPRQPVGWGCFQLGFGRKADPEPGRCRRTDGKKWRCSKEAYPDSKYCEKHMHRGKNRSRKPVELTSTPATTTIVNHSLSINGNLSPTTTSNSPSNSYFSQLSSSTEPEIHHAHQYPGQSNLLNPFFNSHSSSSRPSGFSSHDNTITHNLFMDSGSSHAGKDYSYIQGAREAVDESTASLLSEASGNWRRLQDPYQQFPISGYEKAHSPSQYQCFSDNLKPQCRQQEQQHCFVLGTDIKSSASRSVKLEKAGDSKKPLHQFLGEWSPKDADSWLDLASSSTVRNDT